MYGSWSDPKYLRVIILDSPCDLKVCNQFFGRKPPTSIVPEDRGDFSLLLWNKELKVKELMYRSLYLSIFVIQVNGAYPTDMDFVTFFFMYVLETSVFRYLSECFQIP